MKVKIQARGAGRKAGLAMLFIAIAAGAFPGFGFAEQKASGTVAIKLATLEAIAAEGKSGSLDYAKARNDAAVAAAAVPALFQAKSSTLSAKYSYADPMPGSSGTAGIASATLALPLIEQMGFSATVAQDLSSSLAATLNPLAHSDTRKQALIAYRKALAVVDDRAKAAGKTAVQAALAWMSKNRLLATREKMAALKKDAYDAAKAGNAIDGATTTLDDLVTALKEWSDSRTALVTARSELRNAATAMYSALGASSGEAEVVSLDRDALSSALSALAASLASATAAGPAESHTATAAVLDVESGSARLASIWAFEPDLTLSAGLSRDPSGLISPNASVTLTLSLDDLKGEKMALAAASLDIARKTLALQISSDANSWDQALAAVQAARLESESRKLGRDQSAELAEVAAFGLKTGDCSAIENETAILALAAADDAHYQALVDEYSAWLDLAFLAGI